MNIAAIKKRCMEYGSCVIIANESGQWIGNGDYFYPVDGVELRADGIPALFGMTKKETEEMEIEQQENAMTGILERVVKGSDEPCFECKYDIDTGLGVLHRITGNNTGIRRWYYVNAGVPAKNKERQIDTYIRRDEYGEYLILANGMIVEAVIRLLSSGAQMALEDELRKLITPEPQEEE